ncbi:MAG: Xaa-Pro peptidase family protein [Acidobacteriota bacterium]
MKNSRRSFIKKLVVSTPLPFFISRRYIFSLPIPYEFEERPFTIPIESFSKRIKRAREKMKENGFSHLLISPGTNFYYFTSLRTWYSERTELLILSIDKEPYILCPSFELRRFNRQPLIKNFILWEEHENPFEKLSEFISKSSGSKKIGVDPTMRVITEEGIKKALPDKEILNGEEIINILRMVKEPDEIEALRRASSITLNKLEEGMKKIYPGMTENELQRILGGGLVQFGENSSIPHGYDGTKKLEKNMVILIDKGDRVADYVSDITRTYFFGKPSQKFIEVWETVLRAQEAGMKAAKTGVPCEDVDRAAREVIDKKGYGKYFIHRLGHGLGLDGHEHPYLVKGNKLPLPEGTTITIEPGVYIPGEFGVRIEDDFVVTSKGAEPLSQRIEKLPIINI